MSTSTEELITLQPYRANGTLSVVLTRCTRHQLNGSRVYYSATGEHSGIIVNKPINGTAPKPDSPLQIPIICTISDQSKCSTELRTLMFYFGDDCSEEECKAAAEDFHHDLLHPEIFQRDYCGFIITMIKIIQHRYPQIVRLCCRFETLPHSDPTDLTEAVLRHLQESYPHEQTADAIAECVDHSTAEVVTSLNTLVARGTVRKVGDCYILDDEQLLSVLRVAGPGLTLPQILEHVSQPSQEVERVLSTLLRANRVECHNGRYLLPPPRDDEIEMLLELLESVSPEGMSRQLINDKIRGNISLLLAFVVQQGYATVKDGLYFIRRLEDHEIELVYNTIRKGGGLCCEEIVGLTSLAEIVVLSSINVLEERGDVRAEGGRYYPVMEEIPHDVVVRVYDSVPTHKVDPSGRTPHAVAQVVDIDEEYCGVILNYLTNAQLLSESEGSYHKLSISDVDCSLVLSVLCKFHPSGASITQLAESLSHLDKERIWFILRDLIAGRKANIVGDLYHALPSSLEESRCSDSDIGKVLKTLECVSPSGLTIREISLKCHQSEPIVRKALSNLTQRCFVVAREDKYYSRSFQDDCDTIIGLLRREFPSGMAIGDICAHVGIASQPLVGEILRYLSDQQNSVEMCGKLYFFSPAEMSNDSLVGKLVLRLLAENYPAGLTLAEIRKSDPARLDSLTREDILRASGDIQEEKGRFFYNQASPLSDSDYGQILKVLEAAYPNSLALEGICRESKMSEENVAVVLRRLMEHGQVTEVDRDVFIRSETLLDKSLQRGEVQDTMDPTIAIITSDYSVKVCADLMMGNITTYFKYKLGGESSVYTLGTIGGRRVVATKFSHGYSQASAISAGNATTRLLGTFPRIEHVIILGLGGAVVDTSEVSRHVRLGDVVVSYPGEENSIYFMATNFNFPDSVGESTVTYTVKRWNCLDPKLHQLVRRVHDETAHLAVFPWEEYITQGQSALSLTSQDFHRPALMMDPLSQTRGFRESVLPKELEGRPRMCLGTIGAGRHLHRIENLKEQFVERSRVVAFNDEYDQVTESIHGNCVDSFMLIHGISDYTDGTENGLWHSYAALSAAAVMRYFIEKM